MSDGEIDGRVERWSGQRARRRAEFVEAAIAAVGVSGPNVSIDRITDQLGISRTKLYRHFEGAADLQRAVAWRATEMITAELRPVWNPVGAPREMIETAVAAYVGWITEHPNLYRYLERHSVSATSADQDALRGIKASVGGQLAQLLAAYLAAFEADESPSENLAFAMMGLVESTTDRWLDHPGRVSKAGLIERLSCWVWLLIDDVLRGSDVQLDRDRVLEAPDHLPARMTADR